MGAVAAPKRLSPAVRREQLIDIALAIAARDGSRGSASRESPSAPA